MKDGDGSTALSAVRDFLARGFQGVDLRWAHRAGMDLDACEGHLGFLMTLDDD